MTPQEFRVELSVAVLPITRTQYRSTVDWNRAKHLHRVELGILTGLKGEAGSSMAGRFELGPGLGTRLGSGL